MEALHNWQEEQRSAYLYRIIANIEKNSIHKKLFLELANMAEKQAAIWAQQLHAAGVAIPGKYHPDWRTHVLTWLLHRLGIKPLRAALAAMKIRGMSIYQGENTDHTIPPAVTGSLEHRHQSLNSTNNLRAAIFGMNDGLISNASLILGIAGATTNPHFLLLSGIAGLLAGACSMGAGEYISVRSQREMLEYQLALEKSELELYPDEEAAELSLIYQARGLPREESERISQLLIKDPEKALDTLAREELGINPKELVSPWGAAISSFVSFSLGAFIPLLPFILSQSTHNLSFTIGLTALSLFTVGAILSLFTQRNALWSGLRMLLIGTTAGALTYFIGSLIGLSV
jgi:VIT1/CCC1 family predicted Fe2+/Mn2+ transporter